MYKIGASKASLPENRFTFQVGGKTFSLPKIQYLTIDQMGALEKITDKSGVDDVKAAFAAVSADVGKVVGSLDQEQVGELFQEWTKESGISVGESSPS